MLYSWADSKKKSNLVLSVFSPGVEIPWLGNLKRLMPSAEMQDNPYKLEGNLEESPFPVETSRRRSYHSQASVVWVKGSGLQVYHHNESVMSSRFFQYIDKILVFLNIDIGI